MARLHLMIISPERILFDDEADEIILTTSTGEITILPQHIPLVAQLTSGDVVIKKDGKDEIKLVYGGFLYIKDGVNVTILADAAEHLEELNEKEILEAKKRAEKAIEEANGDETAIATSEAELSRITAQLRSITKHSGIKRRRNPEINDLNK